MLIYCLICYLIQVIFLTFKYQRKESLSLTDKVMTIIAPFHVPVMLSIFGIALYEKN